MEKTGKPKIELATKTKPNNSKKCANWTLRAPSMQELCHKFLYCTFYAKTFVPERPQAVWR